MAHRSSHPDSALQTVLVSKDLARTAAAAAGIARGFHAHAAPSGADATANYWRFRQLDPARFRGGSFRTFAVPGKPGVQLVFGRLTPAVLDAPLARSRTVHSRAETPTGRERVHPYVTTFRSAAALGLVVRVATTAEAAEDLPARPTVRTLLRAFGRGAVELRDAPRATTRTANRETRAAVVAAAVAGDDCGCPHGGDAAPQGVMDWLNATLGQPLR